MLSLVLNPLFSSSFSPNPTAPALLSGLTSPLLSCSLLPLVHTSNLSGKKQICYTQPSFFCNLAATYLIHWGFFCCCCLIFLSSSVCECFAHMHVCLPCVLRALRGQKRVWGPLELELQKIASHCVGLENEPGSPGRAMSAFNSWAIPSDP